MLLPFTSATMAPIAPQSLSPSVTAARRPIYLFSTRALISASALGPLSIRRDLLDVFVPFGVQFLRQIDNLSL